MSACIAELLTQDVRSYEPRVWWTGKPWIWTKDQTKAKRFAAPELATAALPTASPGIPPQRYRLEPLS
jgi:hypothetical protein